MKKFNHLNIPDGWKQYWSRYPQGYTIIEALINWVSQVDDMVDNQNKLTDNVKQFRNELDTFIDQFDISLQGTVIDTLSDWQESGFLDIVIDQALETKFHEMDDRLSTQLAQNTKNIDTRGINVLYPPAPLTGVKGDGESDDWESLQSLIDYAFENDITLELPDRTYLISKPLVIYGSNSTTRRGTSIKGGSREGTKIIKTSSQVDDVFEKNAVMVVTNETKDGNSSARSVHINNLTLQSAENTIVEYGIYVDTVNLVSSLFQYLQVRDVTNGLWFEGANYLNRYDFIRVQNCENGIYHNSGIITSNVYESCYVNVCTGTAYKISGNYVSLINPCADNCSGTIYNLKGLQGTVVSPGSESTGAKIVFDFDGTNPNYTSCVVTGANTWMLDDEDGEHIRMGAGANVTFIGGRINRNIINDNPAPGYLINGSGFSNNLVMLGTKQDGFSKKGTLPSNYQLHFANEPFQNAGNYRGSSVRFRYGDGQDIPTNQFTTVTQWLESDHDTDNFLTDNTYFTIPDGVKRVRFTAGIMWSGETGARTSVRLRKEGESTDIGRLPVLDISTSTTAMNLTSGVLSVSSGDKFYLEVYHEKGSDHSLRGRSENWFNIEVVE